MPSDPAVALYSSSLGSFTPYEFSDFRTEEESWKTTAYLHAGLNPPSPYRLTGPDALRLLREACVNDFTRFSVGASPRSGPSSPPTSTRASPPATSNTTTTHVADVLGRPARDFTDYATSTAATGTWNDSPGS